MAFYGATRRKCGIRGAGVARATMDGLAAGREGDRGRAEAAVMRGISKPSQSFPSVGSHQQHLLLGEEERGRERGRVKEGELTRRGAACAWQRDARRSRISKGDEKTDPIMLRSQCTARKMGNFLIFIKCLCYTRLALFHKS